MVHTLYMYPTEVKALNSQHQEFPGKILAGRCTLQKSIIDYYSLLRFPLLALAPGEWVENATLYLYCTDACGDRRELAVCVKNCECKIVRNKGAYSWDVTDAFPGSGEVELKVYGDVLGGATVLREFGPYSTGASAAITFLIGQPGGETTDIVEEYTATGTVSKSAWIDWAPFKAGGFFVKNHGTGVVELYSEVSPNGILAAQDAGLYLVAGGETSYIAPLRASRFVRLSFRSAAGGSEPITIWFQGLH